MTKTAGTSTTQTDFGAVRSRYEKLAAQSSGFAAQLGKRIGSPDDLALVPAFYKLFPGDNPTRWHYRAAFIVPFLKHSENAQSLGEYIGTQERMKKVGSCEKRILQIARARPENNADIIYLRRLLIMLKEPAVNWNYSGLSQIFSGDEEKNGIGKKKFVEQYFIARENAGKGE
jgi:CRISPR system Cascade subunit CasB